MHFWFFGLWSQTLTDNHCISISLETLTGRHLPLNINFSLSLLNYHLHFWVDSTLVNTPLFSEQSDSDSKIIVLLYQDCSSTNLTYLYGRSPQSVCLLSGSVTCQGLLVDWSCMSYVRHTKLHVSLCHPQRANRNCLQCMVWV